MKSSDKKTKKLEKEEKKKKEEEEKRLKKENEKKVRDDKKKLKEAHKSETIPEKDGLEPKRNSLPNLSSQIDLSTAPSGDPECTSTQNTPTTSTPNTIITPTASTPTQQAQPPQALSPTQPSQSPQPRHPVPNSSPSQSRRDNNRKDNQAFDFWLQREKSSNQSPVSRRSQEEELAVNGNQNPSPHANQPSPASINTRQPPTGSVQVTSGINSGGGSGNNSGNTSGSGNISSGNNSGVSLASTTSTASVTLTAPVQHDSPSTPLGKERPGKSPTRLGKDLPPKPSEVGDRKALVAALASHTSKCVSCMHKTVQVFLHPIYDAAKKEPSMLDTCTKQGFSLYESLHGLINVLREDLDKSIESWSDATSLGSLFLRIVKFFKMYSQYAGQYNIMIAMINFQAFDNPRFEALVKSGEQKMQTEFQCKTDPVVELATNTRIIKPFQLRSLLSQDASQPRITMGDQYDFYSLPTLLLVPVYFMQVQASLLRSLTLATPRQHADYGQLTATLAHLETSINTILSEDDVLYKTLFIQHTIRSSTIGLFGEPLPDRRLLREGLLIEAVGTSKQSYIVFLFTDMVAFTDPPNADGLHMLKKYEIVSECKVSDPDLGFDNKKGFQLKTKDKTSMLYAPSEKDKYEWLQAFNKAQKTTTLTIKNSATDANKSPLTDFESVIRDLKAGEADNIELQSLKAEEGKELVMALGGNQSLSQLSIINSPSLGDRFARSLTSWMTSCLTLTHLVLSNISLSSAAAFLLSDALHYSLHISLLDVRSNSISDPGIVALAEAMIVLPYLTELHLENTACGEIGARSIATNLKHTHALSVLGLEGNSIPADVMVNYFADCVVTALVTPLTLVTFDNTDFQKKIESTLANNRLRKSRKDQDINPTLFSTSGKSTIDVGYMGSGELNIQMLNKVNLYQGNRRLAEVSVLRLDHNSFVSLNESVLDQLTGTHTLLAYHNFLRDLILPTSLLSLSHLDLAHNRLSNIPPSIYSLHGLTWLDVSCNSISSVSVEIKALTNLSTLMLQTNLLTRPPKELLSMTTLTTLSIGGNSSIPTTSQKIYAAWAFKSTKLDFSRSCITALPTDISILTRLSELDLHHNELKTIPPQIGDLTNLRVLDISQNPQMESLPVQLCKLTNLQKLNIEGNHPNMYADGTFKPNMETGAILSALKSQANSQSMQSCSRLKIMLVGQENVGKTTLAKALKQKVSGKRALTMRIKEGALAISLLAPVQHGNTPTTPNLGNNATSSPFGASSAPNVSTDGIEMEEWDPEDDGVSFTIWDFAGQEVYYATHAFFISARSIFIVCFNMATGDEAARVPYWLQCIETWGPGSPVIIVGTHLDEVSKDRADQWTEEVKEKYMTRFPNVHKFVPISSKSPKSIGKLQKTILKLGRGDDSVKKMYPRGLFQLEGLLLSERAMHQNTPPVINRADFAAMAKCCGLDDIPAALEELHRLGVLLYFRDTSSELSDLVILDPKWLARLMATLITTKRAFVKLGILLHSQLEHIWRAPDFPPWLHPALLTMVQRFELCYPLPAKDDSPAEQRFLVPSLLPDTKPAALSSLVLTSLYATTPALSASVLPSLPATETPKTRQTPILSFSGAPLVRLYQFKFLPFGFFSRLMIRIMNFLEPVHYWKTGIVLYKDDNQVCVEYRPHSHSIIVQIWGPKAPTYWRYIRESISVLFDGWYKRLQFQISIPCLCAGCLMDKASSTPTSSPSPVALRTSGSGGSLRGTHSTVPGSSLSLAHSVSANGSGLAQNSSMSGQLASVSSEPILGSTLNSGDKVTGSTETATTVESPVTTSSASSTAQSEQHDNLSDVEDENMAALAKDSKKGKFQTLRKTIRIRVNPRQRSETVNASSPLSSMPHSSSHPTPKDDFAECHIFSYAQCEAAVMSGQRTIVCPKSQINVSLDTIVPELTMLDLVNLLVKFGDLEILEKIAEGGFGAVFKGKLNGSLVAVKQLIEDVHDDAMAAYREFWREVFMSSILIHKCIVSLKAFTMSPCCMVMEYMPNGNLYSYLHTRTDITWQSKLKMAINIADAMAFLHSQKPKICHRDLKSPNILMADKSDPEILCKISDFGESRLVATSGQGRQNLANPLWLAPEVMRGGEYTEKCDVYSFGIIMWELLTGADPFDEYPVAKTGFMSMLEDAIIAGLRPTIPPSCNSDYKTLIEAAWDDDPDKRPTFSSMHTNLLGIKTAKFALRK